MTKHYFKRSKVEELLPTQRDIEILKGLYRYRFLNSHHLLSLTRTNNRQSLNLRLRKLYDAKFIDRPISQTSQWHYGKGKKAMVYALGNEGVKYLKDNLDWYVPKTGTLVDKNKNVKPLYIEHTLEIADFMISIESYCRNSKDIRFIPFDEIIATAPEGVRRRTNLSKWQTTIRWNGKEESIHLIPDAIFGIHLNNKSEGSNKLYFFLEADRGTMPLTRKDVKQTSFLRKLESYRDTYQNKLQEKYFGISNFRVLTVTTSKERAENLVEVCKQNIDGVPAGVFLFSNQFELKKKSLFEIQWFDGKGKFRTLLYSLSRR